MKPGFTLAALLLAAAALTGALAADDEKEGEEKEFSATCVVSGKPALEECSVEVGSKKVYFCCGNCPKAFKADPEKFAAQVHRQYLQTGQIVQVACPFTGRKLNPETAIEIGGVDVCFCCNNCKGKAEKAGDDAIALVFKDISKGFTLQTECPVSSDPIDVTQVLEYEGKNVYFCCDMCPEAFQKDPAKYVEKLPQFQEEEKAKE